MNEIPGDDEPFCLFDTEQRTRCLDDEKAD